MSNLDWNTIIHVSLWQHWTLYTYIFTKGFIVVTVCSLQQSGQPGCVKNNVHDILALLQQHKLILHECSSRMDTGSFFRIDSGATVVVDGTCSMTDTSVLLSACLIRPYMYSVGSILGGSGSSACFHTHAWRWARFTFSKKRLGCWWQCFFLCNTGCSYSDLHTPDLLSHVWYVCLVWSLKVGKSAKRQHWHKQLCRLMRTWNVPICKRVCRSMRLTWSSKYRAYRV